jgi:hypothetical protein
MRFGPGYQWGAVAGNVAVRGNNVGAVTHCRQASNVQFSIGMPDAPDECDQLAAGAGRVGGLGKHGGIAAAALPSRECWQAAATARKAQASRLIAALPRRRRQ